MPKLCKPSEGCICHHFGNQAYAQIQSIRQCCHISKICHSLRIWTCSPVCRPCLCPSQQTKLPCFQRKSIPDCCHMSYFLFCPSPRIAEAQWWAGRSRAAWGRSGPWNLEAAHCPAWCATPREHRVGASQEWAVYSQTHVRGFDNMLLLRSLNVIKLWS